MKRDSDISSRSNASYAQLIIIMECRGPDLPLVPRRPVNLLFVWANNISKKIKLVVNSEKVESAIVDRHRRLPDTDQKKVEMRPISTTNSLTTTCSGLQSAQGVRDRPHYHSNMF